MPIDRPGISDGSGPPSNISSSTPEWLSDSTDPDSRFNDRVGFRYGEGVENARELEDEVEDGLDTIMEDTFNMPDFIDEDGSEQ